MNQRPTICISTALGRFGFMGLLFMAWLVGNNMSGLKKGGIVDLSPACINILLERSALITSGPSMIKAVVMFR